VTFETNREYFMKLRTAVTAATILLAVSGTAFAQGNSGQGPNTGTNASNPPKNTNSSAGTTTDKDRSPASQNSGDKQEK
jgi:hypothetical protein